MATSTSTGMFFPGSPRAEAAHSTVRHRRRISPGAGHALEILGHAIEYLTDELVHDGVELSADNSRVKAVQLLMSLNRRVYFECPEIPTFRERCRSILHF